MKHEPELRGPMKRASYLACLIISSWYWSGDNQKLYSSDFNGIANKEANNIITREALWLAK